MKISVKAFFEAFCYPGVNSDTKWIPSLLQEEKYLDFQHMHMSFWINNAVRRDL